MKKSIILTLSCFLLLFVFVFVSCDNNQGSPNGDDGEEKEYEITIKTDTGKHFSGITVEFLDENGKFLDYKLTDENGNVKSKKLNANEVYVKLYDAPKGYKHNESYKITNEKTEITLNASILEATDLENVTYRVGDIIHDFTLTDKNGVSYTLSDLLKTKEAVVLNFWYNTCHFCMDEFPEMDNAYKNLNSKLEILAINSVDNVFSEETEGLTFPLLRDTIGIENSFTNGIGIWSNPATIIIDRYGVISFAHIGALSEEQMTEIFEYYVSDSYTHSEFNSYTDFNEK